jgi:hypothetical protein
MDFMESMNDPGACSATRARSGRNPEKDGPSGRFWKLLEGQPPPSSPWRYPHFSGIAFIPEGWPILASDFSPWKPLEKACVPSGRLKADGVNGG